MKLRTILVGGVTFALSVGTLVLGCGDDGGAGGGATVEVRYEGGATDEALDSLLAATVVDDPAKSPVFVSPEDGGTLDGSAGLPVISWRAGGGSAAREGSHDQFRVGRTEPTRERGPVERFAEWSLSGIAIAHAHGTPVTGPAYLLSIETADGVEVARIFTTGTETIPSEELWTAMSAAKQPLRLTLTAAEFENNLVAQGGGPWESSISATVAP